MLNQNIHRKEQKQQQSLKGKKLDIDFDAIGGEAPSEGYGTAEEIKPEPVKPEKIKPPLPKYPTKEVSESKKKMKSISSTDYE